MAEPDPHPYVIERSWPNPPLLGAGAALFLTSYGASVIAGAVSDRKADEKLFIPVVGPWLDLDRRDCDSKPCRKETLNKILIGGSGALQGAGAVLVLLGLLVPESKPKWYAVGSERFSVTPQIGSALTGLSARGRF